MINLRVKFRESFRPFAPVVRRERLSDFFELDVESPYMLLVAPVKKEFCLPVPGSVRGFERLKQVGSRIPAVTHVDYSARIQTVSPEQNPRQLLRLWGKDLLAMRRRTESTTYWQPARISDQFDRQF